MSSLLDVRPTVKTLRKTDSRSIFPDDNKMKFLSMIIESQKFMETFFDNEVK